MEAAMSARIDHKAYGCIRDLPALEAWIAEAREAGLVALRTETTSLDPMRAELVGFSIATAPGRAAYLPLGHRTSDSDLLGGGIQPDQVDMDMALALLKPLFADRSVLKIGHNLKYDWLMLRRLGLALEPFDDTMLLSYVLDGGTAGGHDIPSLAEKWLGHAVIPFKDLVGSGRKLVTFDLVEIERATVYSTEGADLAFRLWQVLKPRLVAKGMVSVYERLERPLVPVLARMEERGVLVDRQMLSRLSGEFAQRAAALEDEIYRVAGERFTIGSPKQLGDILFGRMGLPGGTKTKSGQWSTTVQVLEELAAEGHELPRLIVDWRQITKLKSTYTDALPEYINPETRRLHTNYALAATPTGRISSSEPNLQNIPIRTTEGRRIRTAFIADKGNRLVSADYSQIELRVLAHIADIPQLRQAFAEGVDIHAMTASEMFGVPVQGMPPEVRRRAKAINFGIIYGISAFGLANQLGIERSEAGEYIKTYFARFPGIQDYMAQQRKTVKEQGYVETIFGRKVNFPNARSNNPAERSFVERASINAPIQGSAADIIRRAMIRMEPALAAAGAEAKMLLQVHDELIFEVDEGTEEAIMPVIVRTMESASEPAVKLSVPIKVDAHAAHDWDGAH
jgi:DNA polymerase-1